MALNVNALLRDYKSAGIYTIEVDNTQRTIDENQSLRLLVGFNGKGPFNRPVYLETDLDRQRIFGDIDTRLEHKGCFFNRFAQTMLQAGPIFTLNLLNVDNNLDSKDKVNFSAMSLNSAVPNPKVLKTYSGNGKYASIFTEFDYLKDLVDQYFYVFDINETSIPYVGAVNFAELYDRSKFWIPSPENLNIHAAQALTSNNNVTEPYNSNFLNFANVGTEEFSILVFKPENLKGFDVTAAEWYGGKENIPYGFIRPYDYISDYFLQVICVKGNWTNYADLHTDPIWKSYFEEKGIIKGKINNFLAAEGITLLGSWTGIIIPDFVDKQGIPQNLIDKINKNIETTGLMASFNMDAAISLNYDYNGPDTEEGEYGEGCWFLDIDENGSYDIDNGETGNVEFLVDMVGHNIQNSDIKKHSSRMLLTGNPSGSQITTDRGEQFKFTNEENPDFRHISLGEDNNYILNEVLAKKGTFQWQKESTGSTETSVNCIYFSTPESILTYRPINITGIKQTTLQTWREAEPNFPITEDKLDEVNNLEWYSLSNWKKGGSYEGKWIVKIPKNSNELVSEEPGTGDVETTDSRYVLYELEFEIKKGVKNRTNINNMTISSNSFKEISTFYYYNDEKDTLHSFNVSFEKLFKNQNETTTDSSLGNIRPLEPSDSREYLNYSNMVNSIIVETSEQKLYNCQFLSYNYMSDNTEGTDWYGVYLSNPREVITEVENVKYFSDPSCGIDSEGNSPVNGNTRSIFICTDKYEAEKIVVGDYVNNYTSNESHKTYETNIIPGITKVISKLFVTVEKSVNNTYEFTYKGRKYTGYTGNVINTSNSNYSNTWGKLGFYVYTTTEAVDITDGKIIRQLPLSSPEVSYCLKFIPMKGLKISTRHKPGYDTEGKMNIEGGIEKIYSVLADQGIERGLCNPEMVDYRYIVDSMSHGISSELGGKRYLSELAKKRGKTTAILNMPSKKEFAASVNPYFNDSYIMGYNVKPAFDTKYIPQGGNMELYSTSVFTLPDEESGSKFTACFWPNLTYNVNGKNISVPPAADVANTFIRKFNGGNPYVINANLNGLIQNPFVVGLEYDADTTDRDYLEPFGVNTIIRKGGQIMIYGNRTAYQKVKSDLNYLHVREILNTIEINCERILYRYNFAYNTAVLRAAVVTALTPILQEVQEAGAIDSYTIVCDETNNTPEVIAEAMGIVDINVWFNMGMEKIIQRITINRSFTTNNE